MIKYRMFYMTTKTTTSVKKSEPLFSIRMIFWSSFIGGILAGFFMAAYNFHVLNKKKELTGTIIHGVIAALIVSGLAMLFSEMSSNLVLRFFTPLLFATYAWFVINISQGSLLDEKFKKGTPKKRIASAIVVIIPAMVLHFILIMLMIVPLSLLGVF